MSNPKGNHPSPAIISSIRVGRNLTRYTRRTIVKYLNISPPHPPALRCTGGLTGRPPSRTRPVELTLCTQDLAIHLSMMPHECLYYEATLQLGGAFPSVSRCLHIDAPYPQSPGRCTGAPQIGLSAGPPADAATCVRATQILFCRGRKLGYIPIHPADLLHSP